ncbi:hypothetical protein JL722_12524 [Aureococcus anophagefferens]|nr:hypothetical protein JL722_12524 [Aureococcus anophagefferens]
MAATEVVQFTRDLRVNDHGGLRAVADPARGVEAWAPVYVGRDTTEPAVARALGELDAELEARYGARLAVAAGLDVAEWTAPLGRQRASTTGDYRSTLGDALEAHDAPASMPASVDIGFATPPPEARAGASSSAPWSRPRRLLRPPIGRDALDAYLGQGRAAFANARLSGKQAKTTTSLYAASLAWIVGDGAPADRLAFREPAERAFSEPLALGCLSMREVHGAAARAGALSLATTKGKGWRRHPELLVKYYDNNPANADDALVAAISRDALDPGAANVIGSGAKLPPQRSLNEDFAACGPILVPQGAYDGVTGPDLARSARDLETIRPGIDVTLLDAGHCPHDETPDLVADAVAAWWPKAVAFAAGPEKSSFSMFLPRNLDMIVGQ